MPKKFTSAPAPKLSKGVGASVGKNPTKNVKRELAAMAYKAGKKVHPKAHKGGIIRKPTATIRYKKMG